MDNRTGIKMPVWDLFAQKTTVSTLQQEGVHAGMTDLLTGQGVPRVWPPQGCQRDRPQDRSTDWEHTAGHAAVTEVL